MIRTRVFFALLLTALVMAGPSMAEESNSNRAAVPMDSTALAGASGGSETEVTQTITGNTIGSVGDTGSISGISATNNSGMVTMIENTGNQVAISTSTVVNIAMH